VSSRETGHLAAPVAQAPVLFFSSRGKLLLDRALNLRKPLLDAVCDLLAQAPLVCSSLLAISAVAELNFWPRLVPRLSSRLATSAFTSTCAAAETRRKQNSREPRQDKGSDEHGNQQ
jgi:hypothetical protein